jgi:hypothetical protein
LTLGVAVTSPFFAYGMNAELRFGGDSHGGNGIDPEA